MCCGVTGDLSLKMKKGSFCLMQLLLILTYFLKAVYGHIMCISFRLSAFTGSLNNLII